MISLKEAQQQNFSKSTRAELRAYAEELGIEPIPDNANAAQLKKMVCASLGIAVEVEGRAAPTPNLATKLQGSDGIFPSYNLTPNGIWGGRRHRLSIPRPEGAKYAQAEGFMWNGKHTYYIAYDEPDSVPEPIYNIIVQNKRRRVKAERPAGGEVGELTTKWDFDSVPINYMGVDPETANRAGSLLEWYQARGSEWIKALSDRQAQQVIAKLEIPTTVYQGDKLPPRVLTMEEQRGRLMEFLFGFSEADVEPNKSIEL